MKQHLEEHRREAAKLDLLMAEKAPEYSPHARLDYAVYRMAANRAPAANVLLTITEHLERIAPVEHQMFYQSNRADLLAFMGHHAEAYETWGRWLDAAGLTSSPLRASICALADPNRLETSSWREFQNAVQMTNRIVSVVSKHVLPFADVPDYRPEPALCDPFYGTMAIAMPRGVSSCFVYGAGFQDVYRALPGISYPRLVTTLHLLGFNRESASAIARHVETGKVLVIASDAGRKVSASKYEPLADLLHSTTAADVIKLA